MCKKHIQKLFFSKGGYLKPGIECARVPAKKLRYNTLIICKLYFTDTKNRVCPGTRAHGHTPGTL